MPASRTLRPGRVIVVVLLGLLAACAGGTAGASIAAARVWRTAVGLPGDADARAIAGPGGAVQDRVDALFAYDPPVTTTADRVLVPVLGGDDYLAGRVDLAVPVTDAPAALTAERDRLAGEGWRTHNGDYADSFWAAKGHLTVEAAIERQRDDYGRAIPGRWAPSMTVTVRRAEPAGLGTAAPVGWLLGAVAGVALLLGLLWLGRARPRFVVPVAGAGLLALLPATGVGTAIAFTYQAGQFSPEPAAPWEPFTLVLFRGPADLGVALLIVALLLALVAHFQARRAAGRSGALEEETGRLRTAGPVI